MIAIALSLLLAAAPAQGAQPAADLEAAHLAAEASVRAGDYRGAARRYRDIVTDLESRPAGSVPASEWTRTFLQLAVVEGTLGNADASRAAMERALAFDPGLRLDPDLFSPAFRREFEAARARVAASPAPNPAPNLAPPALAATAAPTVVAPAAAPPVPVGTPAPAASLPAASAPTTVSTTASEPAATWMRPAGWVGVGLAAVAAGVATWQGIAASSSYAEATAMRQPDGSLKPGVDPATYNAVSADFHAQQRAAWIAGGAAVVFTAGAVVLLVLAPSSPVKATTSGLALAF